jgi:phosphoribosylformylglycinamidine synthase subunit PurL
LEPGDGLTSDTLVHRQLGLTDEEFDAICTRLEREPSFTELAMFSVMWSEHCSYKSSRVHLRELPTEGEHVLVGPGEGAGIVEVAPGVAVAWKIESHNHPSFVEPFNGAATGVGGIVRDILSMGARPIALLDSLRFGPLGDADTERLRTRYLVEGVVSGISSYGNSIGVPTVGGEAVFEDCYAENPLVNVACLGVVEDRVMTGRATGEGNLFVLIGSATGRDGIGGASVLASASFDEDSLDKRPSVQVGDPFSEKLLIEACLELVKEGLLVGLQDLGAGGISCPASEMTAKSGTGARIHLNRVRRREPGMEPFEVMISESQERMMAVVEPGSVDKVLEICSRWGLDADVVGEVTSTSRVGVAQDGEVVADVPARALAEEGPVYDRPRARPGWADRLTTAPPGDAPPHDLREALHSLLSDPSTASKRWIWEQYDHMIFLGTIVGPGGDAAVIRLPDRREAVALSTDGPGRACYLDPYWGAAAAVAEAARNVACTGARPRAVTNCLNFGDPSKPEVMWQFAEVVRGMGAACEAFETPVVGGNVSFYNETNGRAIYPTPVVGMLGVLEDATLAVSAAFRAEGDAIVLLGTTDPSDFAGSDYAKVVHDTVAGALPRVDLEHEKRLQMLLAALAEHRLVRSAHDLSGGGLAVALTECALGRSVGFEIDELEGEPAEGQPYRWLFAETPGRVVASVSPKKLPELMGMASRAGVAARTIGKTGGNRLVWPDFEMALETARAAYESGLASRLSATMEQMTERRREDGNVG